MVRCYANKRLPCHTVGHYSQYSGSVLTWHEPWPYHSSFTFNMLISEGRGPSKFTSLSKVKRLGKNAQCRENAVVLCRSTTWVLSFTFWWPCYFRGGSRNTKEQVHPLYYGPSQHPALNDLLTWRRASSRCGQLWKESVLGHFFVFCDFEKNMKKKWPVGESSNCSSIIRVYLLPLNKTGNCISMNHGTEGYVKYTRPCLSS